MRVRLLVAAVAAAGLVACGGNDGKQALSPEAAVGQLAFNDPSLSASGRQSCASCHASQTGNAAPNDLAVQLGGPDLDVQGLRASPSIRYLATNTAFHFDDEGAPTGGFFWDGRADSLAMQAGIPLLGAREMANGSKAAVVEKMKRAAWARDFEALHGASVWGDVDDAFDKLTQAIARFELEDASFNAFTSKYDAVQRGQAKLTAREERGRILFDDPAKGNCAACHAAPLFTDFTYDNLGVPRNPAIAANADPGYYDLGLCARADLAGRDDLCGAFKVPSLRNVALRKTFFHNGRFLSLKDALTFYVQRDTDPQKWYTLNADGSVNKFDDLPMKYKGNVNTQEVPYNRAPGDAPALSDAEVDDVIAFLQTLTDGWSR
jgi:cytochrome c peroxidase